LVRSLRDGEAPVAEAWATEALSLPLHVDFQRSAIDGPSIRAQTSSPSLTEQPYGSGEYSARDIEGNMWSFGTYDPNEAAQ
jgi:uncharacterized glyoxalase superfamily protein PhnB